MFREDLLKQVLGTIGQERVKTYGDFHTSMDFFGQLRNLVATKLEGKYTPAHNSAVILALLKIGRIALGDYHPDNYLDAVNYLAQASDSEHRARLQKTPIAIPVEFTPLSERLTQHFKAEG